MSRPRKCRRVCHFPQTLAFYPEGEEGNFSGKDVILTLDEYETIRLIDHEGFSQEQCGSQMRIARTTVQQIYADARKKLADVLVEGRSLRIQGETTGSAMAADNSAPLRTAAGTLAIRPIIYRRERIR